ncbi:G-type lectin S-receptor-like serine/threonine-protein kinase At2g19130 [Fagus crenata]
MKEFLFSNSGTMRSFDHPTNTWLPEAKMVYDRVHNERTTLRSWKNNENPEIGLFSAELEIEENGTTHLVLYYWGWGQHEQYGEKLTPKELNNQYINLSSVSNRNESYFIYSAVSPSTFPRFVLNATGELNLYVWKEDLRQWNLVWKAPPLQYCGLNGFCGHFGICNQQREGVREEIPYNALREETTRSSQFPTCAFQRNQIISEQTTLRNANYTA